MIVARLRVVLGAAVLVILGCAEDVERYSAGPYDAGYYASEPVFVERRVVVIDNRRRTVAIYRMGDSHFYTWGGLGYILTDYPSVTRTRIVSGPLYSSAHLRTIHPNWDDDRRIRRSARRLDPGDDSRYERLRPGDVDDETAAEYSENDPRRSVRW